MTDYNSTVAASGAALDALLTKAETAVQPGLSSYFAKNISAIGQQAVAWSVTPPNTVTTAMPLHIEVNGVVKSIAAGTTVVTPQSPVVGTDYAIWCKPDGTLEATADHTNPVIANARKVGGYHYAPGGNATAITKNAEDNIALGSLTLPADKWALFRFTINSSGVIEVTQAAANATGYATEALAIAALPRGTATNSVCGYMTVLTATGQQWVAGTNALAGGGGTNPAATTNYYTEGYATPARATSNTGVKFAAFNYFMGGNTTPAINDRSCWDLKWRPVCPDPRGMTLATSGLWADIYLLNTDPETNGTSKYGVAIASSASPPKIPSNLGGNGTATYGSLTWYETHALLSAFGKRMPTYAEYMALAFGVTEISGAAAAPTNTALDAPRTSLCGVMQAAGSCWIWAAHQAGGAVSSWVADTEGYGTTYGQQYAMRCGGKSLLPAYSGSRAMNFSVMPSSTATDSHARGVCDHRVIL